MRKMLWLKYLWPGLPQLWQYGSWTGLVLAIAAAGVLDLLLCGSFGWSELIAENVRTRVWTFGGALWLLGVGYSARYCWRRTAAVDPDAGKDTFGEALNHYLKGDYFQAERLLERLLRANVRDLDARLMLATLMRHTGRPEAATQHLDVLERFEGAVKWELEIEHERERLTETYNVRTIHRPCPEGHATGQPRGAAV